MRTILVSLLAACAGATAMAGPSTTTSVLLEPTHRQADILKPARDNQALTLHSFVLDGDGNIVTAVSPQTGRRVLANAANEPTGTVRGWLQVYSPEKKLLREIPLSFVPSALAL